MTSDAEPSPLVARVISLYLAFRCAVNIVWFLTGGWLPSEPPPPPPPACVADPALESAERIAYTSLVASATLVVFVAGMCVGRRF